LDDPLSAEEGETDGTLDGRLVGIAVGNFLLVGRKVIVLVGLVLARLEVGNWLGAPLVRLTGGLDGRLVGRLVEGVPLGTRFGTGLSLLSTDMDPEKVGRLVGRLVGEAVGNLMTDEPDTLVEGVPLGI
jgi:hypothetical protein